MGLARSTFYDPPPVAVGSDELLARIGTICDDFECCGYRRVGAALRQQGVVVNGKKSRRLMRDHGLQQKRRRLYVITTDSATPGRSFQIWPRYRTCNRPHSAAVSVLPKDHKAQEFMTQ